MQYFHIFKRSKWSRKNKTSNETVCHRLRTAFLITTKLPLEWNPWTVLLFVFHLNFCTIQNDNWWAYLQYWFSFECIILFYTDTKSKLKPKSLLYSSLLISMCLCINWTITTPIDTPKGVFLVNYTFSNDIHLELPFSDAKLEHRLISESLCWARDTWESQQGGCPRSRRVLSAGHDSSLHCPGLSDWQWHHDISCPDARWRRPGTLAYLRSSQHLLSSPSHRPFTTLSAWRSETDDANTVRGNTTLAEIVRRLYVSIHRSTKNFLSSLQFVIRCSTTDATMFILCIYLWAQCLQKWRNTKSNEDSGRSAMFVWTGWILESKPASSLS